MRNEDDHATDPIQLPAPARRPLQLNRLTERQLMVDLRGEKSNRTAKAVAATFLDYWHILMKWRWVIGAHGGGGGCAVFDRRFAPDDAHVPRHRRDPDRHGGAQGRRRRPRPPGSAIRGRPNRFIQTQYGVLKSRSLAERVVNKLNLASNGQFLISGAPVLGFIHIRSQINNPVNRDFDYRHRLALKKFMGHLKITPVRGSRLVRISFDSPDPRLAAAVVNATMDGYIEANLERRFQATAYARQFIEDHLREQKDKLEASERALVAYATAQHIVNVGSSTQSADGKTTSAGESLTGASLSSLNESLAQAKGQRIPGGAEVEGGELVVGHGAPPTCSPIRRCRRCRRARPSLRPTTRTSSRSISPTSRR